MLEIKEHKPGIGSRDNTGMNTRDIEESETKLIT